MMTTTASAVKTTITYKDITYKTANINDQVWMAENLRHNQTTSFSLNKDPQNDAIYGRLYRRDAYLSSTICPSGWRLPTESDFQKLLNYIEQNRTCESAALSLIAHSDTWSDLKDVWVVMSLDSALFPPEMKTAMNLLSGMVKMPFLPPAQTQAIIPLNMR